MEATPARSPWRRLVDWGYRQAYRYGYPVASFYWHLTRPEHHGTQVAIWVGGEVLCVRQSYRPWLSFPGGGVEAGEQPEDAARRELREELGLSVGAEQLRYVYQLSGIWDGRRDTIWFFELHLPAAPAVRLDHREILAVNFVDPNSDLAGQRVSRPVVAYLRWREAQAAVG